MEKNRVPWSQAIRYLAARNNHLSEVSGKKKKIPIAAGIAAVSCEK